MEYQGSHVILTREDYNALLRLIKTLQDSNLQLELRVKDLEGKLAKNSGNSSKPPSSDGFNKVVKNNRTKSGKGKGAQTGHKGKTLEKVAVADVYVNHTLEGVCECGQDLASLPLLNIAGRQVIDVPEKLIEVTEHLVEIKQCVCGKIHEACCAIKHPVQYGLGIKSLGVYFTQYQHIPYERTQEIMTEVFGVSISDGVLLESNQACYTGLESTEQQIKTALQNSAVMHNDETGMRCESSLHWVHSASTKTHTHYGIHKKRGAEAINAIGILPNFNGISVHDRWASYADYDCSHALCNAHLLRELKYIYEENQKQWAGEMIDLLVEANNKKKENNLTSFAKQKIVDNYQLIIELAKIEEPPSPLPTVKKRGRIKKTKSLLLLNAFINKKEDILQFIHNQDVPFDNNLAERDLRMVKLKQKISGCFRTLNGAIIFCRIRSYISTTRKQGHKVLEAIKLVLNGNPISC